MKGAIKPSKGNTKISKKSKPIGNNGTDKKYV